MRPAQRKTVFCCNGARKRRKSEIVLEYSPGSPGQNIVASLPKFVDNVLHIPPRTLDLLEIATYVFCADRYAPRGRCDAVEYHSWSRRLMFRIKVRDADFWQRSDVMSALSEAIEFMSGDASIDFEFSPGHTTPPVNLFDRPGIKLHSAGTAPAISLFSGGLDSLAGAIDLLRSGRRTILLSHQSQSGVIRTQRTLVGSLSSRYSSLLSHYEVECHMKGGRPPEETQRTRAFLYCSIAFAIAEAYGTDEFFVHENGVTSINFHRREDQLNARASRTTHPKTMKLLGALFALVGNRTFSLRLPFLDHTKCDIVKMIRTGPMPELISSAVSCSRAFRSEGATHCGTCFQCIDRRIAAYAANADDLDRAGLYAKNVVSASIDELEDRTVAVDYVRQATYFATRGSSWFESEYLSDLADLVDALPIAGTESEKLDMVWRLVQRHGESVRDALQTMRARHDDPFQPLPPRSLLGLIAAREQLKPPVRRLAESICDLISVAIPEAFRSVPPKNEPDFNEKVRAFLKAYEPKLRSEHPTVSFACAKVVPDHVVLDTGLVIESKYIRKNTPPSKASEGIAGDLTKYPRESFIVFLVYDPGHAIISDDVFVSDIEGKAKERCMVKILR